MIPSDFVIEFDNVSKRYDRPVGSLLQSISALIERLGTGRRAHESGDESGCWALRDISVAVKRGETLGIIGENGAGKSTLLKLIAGITAPSRGRIAVKGRVATLIELGAGFKPDLSGRENIRLNAAVLGLDRREIDENFHRIVAFSGLEHCLDVPVKYYSSGMYARLGFAVAAHVNAEIILTDEILAVGDVAFQRQCLNKFEELKQSATIVFVSHDLVAMRKICTRVLWFTRGELRLAGAPDKVVEAYLESVQEDRESTHRRTAGKGPADKRTGSGQIEILEVATFDGQGRARSVLRTFDELLIRIRYRVNEPVHDPGFGVKICSQDDTFVHGTNTFIEGRILNLGPGDGAIELRYPRLPLLAGTYWLTVGATSGNDWSTSYDLWERAERLEVLTDRLDGGIVSFDHHWSDRV